MLVMATEVLNPCPTRKGIVARAVEAEVLQGFSVAQGTDARHYAVVMCVVLVGLGVPRVVKECKIVQIVSDVLRKI